MATTVGGGFVYTSIVGPQGLDSVSGSGPPSPVLLPDLVAGWSLTSGPQQTLDSTGVISGGVDWVEVGGPLSYSAAGVSLNGIDQKLNHAENTIFDVGNSPMLLSMIVNLSAAVAVSQVFTKGQDLAGNSEYFLEGEFANIGDPTHSIRFEFGYQGGNGNYPTETSQATYNTGQDLSILAWIDPANGPFIRVNDQAGQGTAGPDPGNPVLNCATQMGDAGFPGDWFAGTIKYVRLWVGANALTIANNATWRTWLYNGGSGRTDAEVAAYTG